ncbi:putative transporter [Xylogone sp. PMI_703]|nr:putative transporter [Xylogone sp. PMI_703]
MATFKVNWYYVLLVLVISAGGIPKGYDEGGFSAAVTLPSFKNDYNLNAADWEGKASGLANRISNITSFGVLGAALGSAISLLFNDRLGRLFCFRLYTIIWASGILIQIFSSGIYSLLLFARIWGGLGAGAMTVVTPVFLSEIALARSRGWIISWYMLFLLSFLSLGFFINYAANIKMAVTRTQYRLVESIPLIPVGIAFCLSWFFKESPRWLASRDRTAEALEVLTRLRGLDIDTPEVQNELLDIQDEIKVKAQDLQGVSWITIMKDIATTPSYRNRFMLALMVQTVAQWSGGNGITYYVPQIFQYVGIKGAALALLPSGAYGLVKLTLTIVSAWFLVDRVGRRPLFLGGLFLQLVSHAYIGAYLGTKTSSKSASDAAIAMVYVYALGYSVGLTVVQSIYGTEIFPTRIRSVSYAVIMCAHWFFQFAVVKVTPSMFVSLNVWGAYLFWAMICASGLVLLGIWAPETKGVPMEMMEDLFAGKWYMGWKAKVDFTEASRIDRSISINAMSKA